MSSPGPGPGPDRAMVDTILAHYDAAPRAHRAEWLAWYANERKTIRTIAREHGITRRQAAAIVACYSQNASWKGNLTSARRFLRAPARPHGLSIAYGPAARILAGERPLDVLRGGHVYAIAGRKPKRWKRDPIKLRSFYRNLAGDDSALTIDRWAARAAGAGENPKTEAEYDAIAAAYRAAARRRRLKPAALQAIVWCQVRGTDA